MKFYHVQMNRKVYFPREFLNISGNFDHSDYYMCLQYQFDIIKK